MSDDGAAHSRLTPRSTLALRLCGRLAKCPRPRSWSTHHSSYGGLSQPSLYPVLRRLADGYPEKTGAMTAISSALTVTMVQVFIEHEADKVASTQGQPQRIATGPTKR
jgi:hypothetical protein